MAKIKSVSANEILDSRGIPTIETMVELEDGVSEIASVPSGVTTGHFEATELRDNNPKRYRGMGVLNAVAAVNKQISPKVTGLEANDQEIIDKILLGLDGTPMKSNLGANSILSVSEAVCRSAAKSQRIPLFRHLNNLARNLGINIGLLRIPIPTFNIINGGKHGAGNLDFQEFHLIPSSQKTYSESLEMAHSIYESTKDVLVRHGAIHSVGDEGGFAPNLFTNLDALEVLVKAVGLAGRVLGKDVFLSLDLAANFFYKDGKYFIRDRTTPMETGDFIEFLVDLLHQYPLIMVEDPLFEEDWNGWIQLTRQFSKMTVVGDDFLCTNYKRAQEAINKKACNAILIKPNQLGTITETFEIVHLCQQAGWKINVSHRSGETNDTFIADFAVAVGADYVKFGAPARGERVAKYNRLLEIEKELAK